MKILIVYGTTEGQTRKISRFMEQVLQDAGYFVTIADASDDPPSPAGFDAVMIGASIHMHKYQAAVEHYIRRNISALQQMPGAFFSVCLAIASDLVDEQHEAEKIASDFLERIQWEPLAVTTIAGALKYTEYDFFKRIIMKMISKREGRITNTSQNYEYTNWNSVKQFAIAFADAVTKKLHTQHLN